MNLYVIIISLALAYYTLKNRSNINSDDINKLLRQTARWVTAAQQDQSPLIATLHANYAAGYLWALKDIADKDQIKRVTGINIDDVEKRVLATQDMTTRKVVKECPRYTGDIDPFMARIAGEA